MERFIAVSTYNNEIEAELAQATLAAAGIESFLQFEDIGGMLPVLQQSKGVKLLIDEKDELEARSVLNEQSTDLPEE